MEPLSSSRATSGAQPLWQIFDEVAAQYPDRTAVSFGSERITYRELDAKAGRLARQLRAPNPAPPLRANSASRWFYLTYLR